MSLLRSKSGFTLLELMTVTCLMVMVVLCVVAMMIGSMRSYDSASTRTYTDQDAVMAMQMMVSEVREAKCIEILNPGPALGSRLRVYLPMQEAGKPYYDRHQADVAHYIDYYVSDSSGMVGQSGDCLWRVQPGTPARVLKNDVDSVVFASDVYTPREVKITVNTENNTRSGCKRTELTQRVVYLRNY